MFAATSVRLGGGSSVGTSAVSKRSRRAPQRHHAAPHRPLATAAAVSPFSTTSGTSSVAVVVQDELPFRIYTPEANAGASDRRAAAAAATRCPLPPCSLPPAPTTVPCVPRAEYWSTRPVAVTKRTLQIAAALGSWLAEGRLTPWRRDTPQQLTDRCARALEHWSTLRLCCMSMVLC